MMNVFQHIASRHFAEATIEGERWFRIGSISLGDHGVMFGGRNAAQCAPDIMNGFRFATHDVCKSGAVTAYSQRVHTGDLSECLMDGEKILIGLQRAVKVGNFWEDMEIGSVEIQPIFKKTTLSEVIFLLSYPLTRIQLPYVSMAHAEADIADTMTQVAWRRDVSD